MPIVHVVTFSFTPDEAEEVSAALAAALDEFAPRTNAIRYYHGPDVGLREGNAHYAVTAIFDDQDALLAYLGSAEHQQIIRDKITPHLQSRSAVQFDVARKRLVAWGDERPEDN